MKSPLLFGNRFAFIVSAVELASRGRQVTLLIVIIWLDISVSMILLGLKRIYIQWDLNALDVGAFSVRLYPIA
jgi:hypothetical protein